MQQHKLLQLTYPPQLSVDNALLAPTRRHDAQNSALYKALAKLFNLAECPPQNQRQIESFICEAFALAYGATVQRFLPRLYTLRSKDGNLLTAFGVRSAQHQHLFLETYLDRPIEQAIEDKVCVKVARNKIMEIGNLAAICPGMVRWMIVALTVMLYEQGYDWVVFTGTSALRNSIYKLGLEPEEICSAKIEHLSPDERVHWGTYYDHKPAVIVGNIAQGFHTMQGNRPLLAMLSKENLRISRIISDRVQIAESA